MAAWPPHSIRSVSHPPRRMEPPMRVRGASFTRLTHACARRPSWCFLSGTYACLSSPHSERLSLSVTLGGKVWDVVSPLPGAGCSAARSPQAGSSQTREEKARRGVGSRRPSGCRLSVQLCSCQMWAGREHFTRLLLLNQVMNSRRSRKITVGLRPSSACPPNLIDLMKADFAGT